MLGDSIAQPAASRLRSIASHYAVSLRQDGVRVPCPAHQGEHPNLHLWADDAKARIGAFCHSRGCGYDAIAAAIADACGVGIGPNERRVSVTDYGQGRVVTRTDEPGKAKRVSNRRGTKFLGTPVKLFQPDPPSGYPSMAVVCEGELTAAALADAGLVAATWIGGAGKEKFSDFSPLAAFGSVVLWPDDDPLGRNAADAVASALSALSDGGPELSIVKPPDYDGFSKRDAADYPPGMRLELVLSASPFAAPPGPSVPSPSPESRADGFTETSVMSDAWRMLERFGRRILLAAPADPDDRHSVYVLDLGTGIWRGGAEPVELVNSDTAKAFAVDSVTASLQHSLSPQESRTRVSWARRAQSPSGAADAGKMLWAAAAQMQDSGYDSAVKVRSELDIDPVGRYLGCANGVVDLDTGELLRPEDAAVHLVTRLAPHDYDPGSEHPDVSGLLGHVGYELREFLLNSAGYALRGVPNRRIIVMAGQPNSGKSTFFRALHTALAPSLCFALPAASLLRERMVHKNQHNAGMTPLLTARIATAAELPRNDSLVDEGVLKSISGGDSQSLREPNQRTRLNRPASATVFLALNTVESGCDDLSRIPTKDEAIRDRLQVVELPSIPGFRDPAVLERLSTPGAGRAVLAMLVSRAVRNPLPPAPPPAVSEAMERLYHGYLGVVGSWGAQNLVFTQSRGDYVSPSRIWEALCAYLDSVDAPYPGSRKAALEEIRSAVSLPRQEPRRISGEVVNVYPGVRLRE